MVKRQRGSARLSSDDENSNAVGMNCKEKQELRLKLRSHIFAEHGVHILYVNPLATTRVARRRRDGRTKQEEKMKLRGWRKARNRAGA